MATKQKKYLSVMGTKKHLKSNKNLQSTSENEPPSSDADKANQKIVNTIAVSLFEVINLLKKDKANCLRFCNFLRYPFSYIYNSATPEWQAYQ